MCLNRNRALKQKNIRVYLRPSAVLFSDLASFVPCAETVP